ncbi:hypothetical protein K3495_g1911 [Podosphaera aphanis]|nr:hypothetical protein K3495_g1911 [Podosphaera aphanis]
MLNANQYLLLADHIKLSLLERQQAISLKLQPTSHDSQISRSLDSLREGIQKINSEQTRIEESGDNDEFRLTQDLARNLQAKYDELTAEFRGKALEGIPFVASRENDLAFSTAPTKSDDRHRVRTSSLSLKTSFRGSPPSNGLKSVRFTDPPLETEPNALFPYRDDPTSLDQSCLDNQQIHAYHSQIMARQDEALDRLGESIGRQREISIQIGDELDEHVQMLDDVDHRVDRHQTRLDNTMTDLRRVARRARDNKQLTVIAVLIIILIFLIVVLK